MKKKQIKQVGLFILDKSGSMSSIRGATVSGFNEYLNKLQKNKVNVAFNMTLFDDDCTTQRYHMTPIKEVRPLNEESYVPCGMTPLYDHAVSTIEKLAEEVKEIEGTVAVSVVIMTDGLENASKLHNEKCLRDLIKKLEKKGNWTFAYMGANQDSYAVAGGIGIARGNTVNWSATPEGSMMAFASLADASVANYRAVNAKGLATSAFNAKDLHTNNFFNNQESFKGLGKTGGGGGK